MELLIIVVMVIISVLLIMAVLLQPSQKSGLIGDATDIETREKRGSELFLYRLTIILIILFFTVALLYPVVTQIIELKASLAAV